MTTVIFVQENKNMMTIHPWDESQRDVSVEAKPTTTKNRQERPNTKILSVSKKKRNA